MNRVQIRHCRPGGPPFFSYLGYRLAIVIISSLLVAPDSIAQTLLPPRLIHSVDPTFPTEPNIPPQGMVGARLHVDPHGDVINIEITEISHPAFRENAVFALSRFRFAPARRDGVPITSVVIYHLQFAAPPPPPIPPEKKRVAPAPAKEYETVVRDQRTPASLSRQLHADEIKRIPGIHGDAVLAIQTLPGVAKPPAMLGALFIRGSDDADSLSLVDGLPVPTVFHFGSINTILNSDMIETVHFLPGNFPVRYGPGTGGVVDIETRMPKQDRLHAYLDVDIWDAAVFAEGPINSNWSVAASFRRSYIDAVLKGTHLLEKQLQFTIAPRYYDFQAKAVYRPSSRHTLSILFFGSDDKVTFGDGLLGEETYLSREINTRAFFYMASAAWHTQLSSKLSHSLSFRAGLSRQNGDKTVSTTKRRSFPVHLRDEIIYEPLPELRFNLGLDTGAGHHRIATSQKYDQATTVENNFEIHPGAYAEVELRAIPYTRLSYGIRMNYNTLTDNIDLDPRFNFSIQPTPLTQIKGGFGLFHQSPPLLISLSEKKNLKSMAAIHYSIGLSQTIPKHRLLTIEIGTFYKDLRRVTFSHHGGGNVVGMELMLNHRPNDRFFGWLSYTLMKSRRFLYSAPTQIPFDFDQTHVLTVVAGLKLKYEIGLGLRFRLASGFPYTPLIGYRYFDDWSAVTIPIWGESNSARMPMFHQLDLRIDKTFKISHLLVVVYIDVQNIYNRHNPVFFMYNNSYSQRKTIYDLPILPSIGLKVAY